MSRRLPQWITKKLGAGDQSNGRSAEEYEEAIRQEKKESSRIEGWKPYVVGNKNIHSN